MKLRMEAGQDFLLVTAIGEPTFPKALDQIREIFDASAQQGLDKILVDFLAIKHEWSTFDRYDLGVAMAAYARALGVRPKIALIGVNPPTDGFAAVVYGNRGGHIKVFSNHEEAERWLKHSRRPFVPPRCKPGEKVRSRD